MPIHYLAGPGLAQAGQAAAPIDAAVRRQQELALQTQAQNRAFTLREAQAQAKLQDEQREAVAKSQESLRRGIQQSINIGSDLGFDTDYAGFQAIESELKRRDPEMHAQMSAVFGIPESDTSTDYPFAFNGFGKALANVRSRDSRVSKEKEALTFAEEADGSEYTEEQVLRIQSAALDPNVTPAELQLEIERERASARTAIEKRMRVERGRDESRELSRKHAGRLSEDPEALEIWARLQTGQSRSVEMDLARLRIMLEDNKDALGMIEADAFQMGQAAERQRAARQATRSETASASPIPQPRPTGGPQPQMAQADGAVVPQGIEAYPNLGILAPIEAPADLGGGLGDMINERLDEAGVGAETEVGRIIVKQLLEGMSPVERATLQGDFPVARPPVDARDIVRGNVPGSRPRLQSIFDAETRNSYEEWKSLRGMTVDELEANRANLRDFLPRHLPLN